MTKLSPTIWFAGVLLAFTTSCADPIELGRSLIEEDILQVAITDTFKVRTLTVTTEPTRTYSPPTEDLIILSRGPFGDMADPSFGNVKSNLIVQFRLPKDNFGFPVDPLFNDNAVYDSLVLIFPYTGSEGYGNVDGETFGMDVQRLAEGLDADQEYFTDTQLSNTGIPLYSGQFRADLDSTQRINFQNGFPDTVRFPHVRIPLDDNFGLELLNADSLIFTSDSLFQDFLKGMELQPTLPTPGMMDLDLASSQAGMIMYYRRQDTILSNYQFTFNTPAVRTARYEHDFTGSPAEPFIDTPQDSLAFLQGLGGPMIEVSFPDLDQLSNVIVNKAELEFSVAELPGDSINQFFPPFQLTISERNDEGDLVVVEDIRSLTLDPSFPNEFKFDQTILLNAILPDQAFGGVLEGGENGEPFKYRLNLTAHLQGFIERGGNGKLFLSLNPKAQTPERVVLYGSGHSTYAPKLLLAITRIE